LLKRKGEKQHTLMEEGEDKDTGEQEGVMDLDGHGKLRKRKEHELTGVVGGGETQ